MAPLNIEVTGKSLIHRTAERGHLKADVSSTGKSQEIVSDNVTQTCNKLRSMFHDLAPKTAEGLATADAPVTQFSMSAFSTSSYVPRDKDNNELEREYTARTTFTTIFRDFAKLGEITSQLFRMPYVAVGDTEWKLTPDTIESLGSESRKAAMQDAIRKARDYAEVLGREPVAVEVKDSGSYSHGRTMQTARRSRGNEKTQVDGLTLEPEDVSLKTEIHVRFQAD